jgi:hypothetical protein
MLMVTAWRWLLAAVRHAWVTELENQGYAQGFGTPAADPYLARTLPRRGALLEDYYAIGHASADNYIAQVSGQAPSLGTQAGDQYAPATTGSRSSARPLPPERAPAREGRARWRPHRRGPAVPAHQAGHGQHCPVQPLLAAAHHRRTSSACRTWATRPCHRSGPSAPTYSARRLLDSPPVRQPALISGPVSVLLRLDSQLLAQRTGRAGIHSSSSPCH